MIGGLLDGVKAKNDGTIVAVERNEQSQFKRLFIMLGQHVEVCASIFD